MKLWLIERDDTGYDEWAGFVVRAATEQEARAIACQHCSEYDSGKTSFSLPERSTVSEVTVEGEPGIILGS